MYLLPQAARITERQVIRGPRAWVGPGDDPIGRICFVLWAAGTVGGLCIQDQGARAGISCLFRMRERMHMSSCMYLLFMVVHYRPMIVTLGIAFYFGRLAGFFCGV